MAPALALFTLQANKDWQATNATDDTVEREGSISAPRCAMLGRLRGRTSYGNLEDDVAMDEMMTIQPPWEGLTATREEIYACPVAWYTVDSLSMNFVTGLSTPLHIAELRPKQLRLELSVMPRLAAAATKGIGRI